MIDNTYTAHGGGHEAVSGTLISSHWVLTAAHVVQGGDNASIKLGGKSYAISQFYVDPQWANNPGQQDFALAYIGGDGVTGINPLALYDGVSSVGQAVTSVGFGNTGTGITGVDSFTVDERAFHNVIQGINATVKYADGSTNMDPGFIADFNNPQGTSDTLSYLYAKNSIQGEGCVAWSDSGGGLFSTINGQQVQIGVSSYEDSLYNNEGVAIGKYGDWSGWSDIATASGWIQQVSGVQAVPEPGSFGLMVLGVGALLRRRSVKRA